VIAQRLIPVVIAKLKCHVNLKLLVKTVVLVLMLLIFQGTVVLVQLHTKEQIARVSFLVLLLLVKTLEPVLTLELELLIMYVLVQQHTLEPIAKLSFHAQVLLVKTVALVLILLTFLHSLVVVLQVSLAHSVKLLFHVLQAHV
jgi:hypothetical protein